MNFFFARQRREKIARRKRGAGERREGRRTLLADFETALRRRCGMTALTNLVAASDGYGFLRGRPGLLLGNAICAAFFGSTSGLKSGYFAM